MRFLKPKTFRSKPYLAFIREHPCEVCRNPHTVAHHEGLGDSNMMGGKPPDTQTLPLCPFCHKLRHDLGRRWLEDEGVNIERRIITFLTEYLQEREK